jgi:hypothetical protein
MPAFSQSLVHSPLEIPGILAVVGALTARRRG